MRYWIATAFLLLGACGGGEPVQTTELATKSGAGDKQVLAVPSNSVAALPGAKGNFLPAWNVVCGNLKTTSPRFIADMCLRNGYIDPDTGLTLGIDAGIDLPAADRDANPLPAPFVTIDKLRYQSDRLLIVPKASATFDQMHGFARELGWSIIGYVKSANVYIVVLNGRLSIPEGIRVAKASALIQAAGPLGELLPAFFDDKEYAEYPMGEVALREIRAFEAHELLASNALKVPVGIIDRELRRDHEDLPGVLPSLYFYDNAPVRDVPVLVDQCSGFFKAKPEACEDMHHGMQVAGIIGAEQSNQKGVAGVAGLSAEIHGYKLVSGNPATISKGIERLGAAGVKVINMSVGAPACVEDKNGDQLDVDGKRYLCMPISLMSPGETPYESLVANAKTLWNSVSANPDIVFVQSSMNFGALRFTDSQERISAAASGSLASGASKLFSNDISETERAVFEKRSLIVGSFSVRNGRREVSAFTQLPAMVDRDVNSKYPFILAPGEGIPSLGVSSRDEYRSASGTSLAAPMVTGAVVQILRALPGASPEKVVEIILSTADDNFGQPFNGRNSDGYDGFRYLNVERAVQKAQAAVVREITVDHDTFIWWGGYESGRGEHRNFDYDARLVTCGYAWQLSGNGTAKSLLKFNVSGIPASATTVYLNLFKSASDNNYGATVEAYKALVPWVETEVTWNVWHSSGSYDVAMNYGAISVPQSTEQEWVRVPITHLVKEWQQGVSQNHGLMLDSRSNSLSGCRVFNSLRATTNRPFISWE